MAKKPDITYCTFCKPNTMFSTQEKHQHHALERHRDVLYTKGVKTIGKGFDLTSIYNESRPMSWSAISSFEWNPRDWYKRYVLKEESPKSPELEFGSKVDWKIQKDPAFLPHLVRYPVFQHKLTGMFNGIPMIGYADAYHPKLPAIRDYKTGRKAWDQKRADETGQLTLYVFFLYMMEKVKPESVELYIDWLPTHIKDGKLRFVESHKTLKPRTFRTKRTMADIMRFGERINETWKAMEKFAAAEQNSVVHSRKDW